VQHHPQAAAAYGGIIVAVRQRLRIAAIPRQVRISPGSKKLRLRILTKFYNCIICRAAASSPRHSQMMFFLAMMEITRLLLSHPNE
jgi:hypothetical protein